MNPSSAATDFHNSRLWNLNFFLLWQGKLVSQVGDVVYSIALGFWILAEFLNLRLLISGCYFITLVCFIPMAFMSDIVKLLNFDAETGVSVISNWRSTGKATYNFCPWRKA
jgi:hypothetical protein